MITPQEQNVMKKLILTNCVSFFAVMALILTGCPQSDNASAPPATPQGGSTQGATTTEPVVLPMSPETDSKPAEDSIPSAPAAPEGAFMIPAEISGRIADEAIPMAPIDDLVGQIDEYVEKIGKNLEEMDGTVNYKNDADTIVRDANGLALVALSVGMSKEDSKYKKAAPAIIKAAMTLEKVEKYDEAKKAYDALKEALTSEAGGELGWTKVAELPPVMKAVPNLSSTLTRLTNTENKLKRQLDRKPQQIYGGLAALAAIAQGSVANAKDTTKPDAVDDWKKECESFRDAALKANAAAHDFAAEKIDYDTYWKTYKAMTDSCDNCHKVFYPSAVGQAE